MSENERLRAVLDWLLEYARFALEYGVVRGGWRVDMEVIRELCADALAAMPETCVWYSRKDYTYTRSCDGRHTALMPGSYLDGSDFQTDELCPGCGHKIEVKE